MQVRAQIARCLRIVVTGQIGSGRTVGAMWSGYASGSARNLPAGSSAPADQPSLAGRSGKLTPLAGISSGPSSHRTHPNQAPPAPMLHDFPPPREVASINQVSCCPPCQIAAQWLWTEAQAPVPQSSDSNELRRKMPRVTWGTWDWPNPRFAHRNLLPSSRCGNGLKVLDQPCLPSPASSRATCHVPQYDPRQCCGTQPTRDRQILIISTIEGHQSTRQDW